MPRTSHGHLASPREVLRIAAFADGGEGGNPGRRVARRRAAATGRDAAGGARGRLFQTVFAAPEGDGCRVRYFSPESEVAFCGHATIALGAALPSGTATASTRWR